MNRDHLRLVVANSAPCEVTQMDTFSFARVDGALVIMHNDKPISAPEALLQITWLLKPALLACGPRVAEPELKLRRMLPGDLGGGDLLFDDGGGVA